MRKLPQHCADVRPAVGPDPSHQRESVSKPTANRRPGDRSCQRLPNFLICGVASGGTSFLADAIGQHPDVFMPRRAVPEPHFFLKSWEFAKGIEHYWREWFSEVRTQAAIGEKSSSYLFGGRVTAARIAHHLPGVRLIVMLRNPIERTWANYRFTVLNGLESLGFEEALDAESERIAAQTGQWREIQPYNYTGRGFYAAQIEQFLGVFGSRQILVLKTEHFGIDPQSQYRRLFQFLGIERTFVPAPPPRFSSWGVRDPALQTAAREHFGDRFELIVRAIRSRTDPYRHMLAQEDRPIIDSLVDNIYEGAQPMSASARAYLHGVFREDLKNLGSLVEFDISDWQRA